MSDTTIFGTDGIRGPAYVYPLDEVGARQVGKAVAQYFGDSGTILIGRDTRESSQMLETAVTDGAASMGVTVASLGVVPTAGLAYLTRQTTALAGIMITASHNPYTDNGIKVFSAKGTKLSDETEAALDALIKSQKKAGQPRAAVIQDATPLIRQYQDFLVATAEAVDFSTLHIALDCANGATSFIARNIFDRLNAAVRMLNDTPNGTNINDHCGATYTAPLQAAVIDNGLQAGIAFDGDGDRAILVDEKGRVLTGDHILYILALSRNEPGIVATLMSNMGLETALKSHHINLLRTAVGDRYVVDGLEQSGYKLGGEQSGHVVMTDYTTTGDGLLTAIQVLKYVIASKKSLADWHDELTILPQALINIPVRDKTILNNPTIQTFINEQMTQMKNDGRLNIRASGTEPVIRVMLESFNAQNKAERIAQQLEAQIKNVEESTKV